MKMYSRKRYAQKHSFEERQHLLNICAKTFHQTKPINREKRQNKTKHATWNPLSYEFMKKTSISHPVEALGYIKCRRSKTSRPINNLSTSIRYNCQKIYSESRKPGAILTIAKEAKILAAISKPIIMISIHSNKSKRAVAFSHMWKNLADMLRISELLFFKGTTRKQASPDTFKNWRPPVNWP